MKMCFGTGQQKSHLLLKHYVLYIICFNLPTVDPGARDPPPTQLFSSQRTYVDVVL